MIRWRITENGRPLEQYGNPKNRWRVLANYWFSNGLAGTYYEEAKCLAHIEKAGLKVDSVEVAE